MSFRFASCLRRQSARDFHQTSRTTWRRGHTWRSSVRDDNCPHGRTWGTRCLSIPNLPRMSRKMITPSRGMIVPHDSGVVVARQRVINGVDLFAAFVGASLVRPSPYVTQASGPAHRAPSTSHVNEPCTLEMKKGENLHRIILRAFDKGILVRDAVERRTRPSRERFDWRKPSDIPLILPVLAELIQRRLNARDGRPTGRVRLSRCR
jgi:hypothetical protein